MSHCPFCQSKPLQWDLHYSGILATRPGTSLVMNRITIMIRSTIMNRSIIMIRSTVMNRITIMNYSTIMIRSIILVHSIVLLYSIVQNFVMELARLPGLEPGIGV